MNTKQQIVATIVLTVLVANSAVRAEAIEYSIVDKSAMTVSTSRLLQKDVPLTFPVKDLDSTWQFITLNDSQLMTDKDRSLVVASSVHAAIDESLHIAPNVYLTRWQTVTSGGQSFLIAYRAVPLIDDEKVRTFLARTPLNDFATKKEFLDSLIQSSDARPLELVLLNLQSISSIALIEPYSVERRDQILEIFIVRSNFVETRNKFDFQSMTNLKQLASGLFMYMHYNDGKMPPMRDYAAWKKALFSYGTANNEKLYKHPSSQQLYALNAALSDTKWSDIKNSSHIVVVYESKVSTTDGRRAVAFADGYVKRVTQAEWTQIKKDSGIK